MIKATYQIGVNIIGEPLIITHWFKQTFTPKKKK